MSGTLYVVATPIGHLGDLSPRATEVLRAVAGVCAEDTRHSAVLLKHAAIHTPLHPLHSHNEDNASERCLQRLRDGEDMALISDAGTPLISDPGAILVARARAAGLRVVAVPGPCALVAALSVSGLPAHPFSFQGFLPTGGGKRRSALQACRLAQCTQICYEAPHRMEDLMNDVVAEYGAHHPVFVGRELTKTHEQGVLAGAAAIAAALREGDIPIKGEFVVILAPWQAEEVPSWPNDLAVAARDLLNDFSAKDTKMILQRLSGLSRKVVHSTVERCKNETTPEA